MTRTQLQIAIGNFIYEDLLKNGLGNAENISKKLIEELERLNVLKQESESQGDLNFLRSEV